MRSRFFTLVAFVVLFFSSCADFHSAQETLRQADSLRAEGIVIDDSVAVAHAANYFSSSLRPFFFPARYAKANYYYGRLLDNHNDQVAAMQAFLCAAHTDPNYPSRAARKGFPLRKISAEHYNILGRVYCNIGVLCSLCDEHSMAYQQYEKSATNFKLGHNETAYYYALDDMAYAFTQNQQNDKAIEQLAIIEKQCKDSAVLTKILETKAIAYRNCELYDSALYQINKLQSLGFSDPSATLIKAQCFGFLQQYDSAVIYARIVANHPQTKENLSNAYYILQHYDCTINIDSVNQLAADRTDVNDSLDKSHSKLAQAVQLLEQDQNRSIDYKHIIVLIIIFIFLVGILQIWYMHIKSKKDALQDVITQKQEEHENLVQQISSLKKEIVNMEDSNNQYKERRLRQLKNTINTLLSADNMLEIISWQDPNELYKYVNTNLFMLSAKLKQQYQLSDVEIKLCILVLLNDYSSPQLADLLCYGRSGIRNLKSRTAKKLNTNSIHLRETIENIAINDTHS